MSDVTVGIIMGSSSDLPVMEAAAGVLTEFGVAHEVRVVSAHRSPRRMVAYATEARDRGLQVIIAGAGGAAHLPGMVASLTTLPVIGVPIPTEHLRGVDSLHSIVQMPGGVPVATMAIGGARNAGLMAVRMLAIADEHLAARLAEDQLALEQYALAQDAGLDRP
jgi:5-(carboxyamino)imidazole ribonucleotide mutase